MKAIGIILAGGNNNRMKELTAKRAVPALPVAGSFRSIDFALSSMSNSHILTQYNARSLNEHLSSSKWWNFGRKQGGLFLFTPTVTADNSDWYRGTADAMYQNIDFLKRRHEPYVIISSGDCVYKLDFNRVLDFHIEKKSDITPHFAIFLHDVQRAGKEPNYKTGQTFLTGHFKAYTIGLNPLDGVYYCDLRPIMKTDDLLKEHIKSLDYLLCEDVWKFV